VSALKGHEVCDEFEWLVANGMSAALAAETLGRNVAAMSRMLYRYRANRAYCGVGEVS
jgi:hypothetical protein